jgi:hypothetical protein
MQKLIDEEDKKTIDNILKVIDFVKINNEKTKNPNGLRFLQDINKSTLSIGYSEKDVLEYCRNIKEWLNIGNFIGTISPVGINDDQYVESKTNIVMLWQSVIIKFKVILEIYAIDIGNYIKRTEKFTSELERDFKLNEKFILKLQKKIKK